MLDTSFLVAVFLAFYLQAALLFPNRQRNQPHHRRKYRVVSNQLCQKASRLHSRATVQVKLLKSQVEKLSLQISNSLLKADPLISSMQTAAATPLWYPIQIPPPLPKRRNSISGQLGEFSGGDAHSYNISFDALKALDLVADSRIFRVELSSNAKPFFVFEFTLLAPDVTATFQSGTSATPVPVHSITGPAAKEYLGLGGSIDIKYDTQKSINFSWEYTKSDKVTDTASFSPDVVSSFFAQDGEYIIRFDDLPDVVRRDRYLVVTATEGAPPKVIFQFYAQFEASSNSNIIEPHQNSTWVINKRNDFRIRIPLNTDVAKIAIKVSPVTDPNDSRSVAAKPETAAVDKSSTYVEVASQTIPDNYYLLVTFPRIGDTTSPPLDIVQVVKTTQSLEDIIGNPYTLAAALAVPISITWSPGDISNTTAGPLLYFAYSWTYGGESGSDGAGIFIAPTSVGIFWNPLLTSLSGTDWLSIFTFGVGMGLFQNHLILGVATNWNDGLPGARFIGAYRF